MSGTQLDPLECPLTRGRARLAPWTRGGGIQTQKGAASEGCSVSPGRLPESSRAFPQIAA